MDRNPLGVRGSGKAKYSFLEAGDSSQEAEKASRPETVPPDGHARSQRGRSSCPRGIYGAAHAVQGQAGHSDKHYAREKRVLDIMACLLAAPIILPLALVCVIAVRCSSPGPIFFRQKRVGKGGRKFEMLKFRSMVVDAEAQKDALKESKGMTGPDFKLEHDPRVTRFGSLMRKTSLDELPQLWNVFKGDMSLVGPRPTSFGVETYEGWHAERLEVKPGLTGLWQIKARGDLDFDYRVRLDIAYVRHRSLLLDLWILLCTAPSVISQKGAY